MNSWVVKKRGKIDINKPVLIEGLPGIGNVGKVAVDFLIEHKKLKPIVEFTSPELPHAVFVNERDNVTLPCLQLFHLQVKKKDFLFLAGDVQPQFETSCHGFCQKLLALLDEWKCQEIITLGGIGLNQVSEIPRMYCAGNNRSIIKKYKTALGITHKTYGVVGPIVGITGLLVGLAKAHNIPAVALLTETYNHPMYVGVKEARQLITFFNKQFTFSLPLDVLDKEIAILEKEIIKKAKNIQQFTEGKGVRQEHLKYIG